MPSLLLVGPSSRGIGIPASRRRTTLTSGARRRRGGTTDMSAQVRRIRLVQAAAAAIGVAVMAESARLAITTSWYAFGDISTWSAVLGLAAGAALLVAGTVEFGSAPSRTSGALLAAGALAWLMTPWDSPAAPPWIFTAGRILATAWPVLV